jgi:hypothetical protein
VHARPRAARGRLDPPLQVLLSQRRQTPGMKLVYFATYISVLAWRSSRYSATELESWRSSWNGTPAHA